MGISTKSVMSSDNGGGIPKIIQPGTHELKITSISVQVMPFDAEQKQIVLNCETRLIENFEGFFIDKDNQSLGRHDGQVGRINARRYPFSNYESGDLKIDREEEMLKFMKALCISSDTLDWFEAVDGKYDTMEDLVTAYNNDKPFADKWFRAVVCGKEYQSGSGYVNHQLFFERPTRAGLGMELVETNPSKLVAYDESKHIIKLKEDTSFNKDDVKDELETVDVSGPADDDVPF